MQNGANYKFISCSITLKGWQGVGGREREEKRTNYKLEGMFFLQNAVNKWLGSICIQIVKKY